MKRYSLLFALLALAYALRLWPVVGHPSLNWGDEVFQTTEQAHRLVYGTGLIPWEFQVGMRSWLLPGAIAGVMWLARAVAPGPDVYLPAIAGALGLLALLPVLCGFLWCRRKLGAGPALLAALVAATAPELVYFGDRALAEVVAAHVLVAAMYVLRPGYAVQAARRLALGGALLGLVLVLRLQLLPAVALVSVLAAWRGRALPMLAGLAGAVLAGGALDAVTLGAPFAASWRYVEYNVVLHASTAFGVQPWYYFGLTALAVWGALILVPLGLCVAGRRVSLEPALVALVIVASHLALGHKEQRFIYPALVLLAVQAGFGLAAVASLLAAKLRRDGLPPAFAQTVVAAGWCLVAWLVWQGDGMRILRERVADQLAAAHYAAHAPAVCGIGLYGPGPDAWAPYGGYSHIHQPVPLYWPADKAAFAAYAEGFNVLLSGAAPPDDRFRQEQCFGSVCAWRRDGGCVALAPMRMPFPVLR